MINDEASHNRQKLEIARLREEIRLLKAGQQTATERRDEIDAVAEDRRLSQIRYRTVFEKSLSGNKIITPDLKILQVNQALLDILGFDHKDELIGRHILEFAHPDFKADWQILQDKLWHKKLPSFNLETCLLRKDGQQVWVSVTSMLFMDDGGTLGYTIIEDIQERRSAMNSLLIRETRFKMITDIMPQQVWTAEPDGRLNFVNQQVCTYFGRAADDLTGNGWQDFLYPDDVAPCLSAWQRSVTTGEEYMIQFRLRGASSDYKWYLGRAVPIYDDGAITFWLGTNTDIDAQKTNEQRKDEFMSIASHELKTPLTSIKAFNQIMQRADTVEKMRPFLQRSGDHIHRLERLINDLLDVTKINSGKMVFENQPFDFSAMLNEIVESSRHFSEKHELILEEQAAVTYTGDRYRLEQVIHNFISNAIKYSPEGKKIIIKSQLTDGNLVVSVQDFGIGIAKENLDKLFDRYYRVDNTSMRFEGLGLGLFISSEILKRHKGTFWIESEPGKGSTFYFLLPLPEKAVKNAAKQTAISYEDPTIRIDYRENKHRLDVDWTGFQNLDTVQAGCIKMWEMLKQHQVHKIVNDNTHVLGSWSEAVEWTGNVWFPMMEKAGLKYFALIYSPSVFSQLSAEKSIDVGIGGMTARYFTEVALAEAWIDSIS